MYLNEMLEDLISINVNIIQPYKINHCNCESKFNCYCNSSHQWTNVITNIPTNVHHYYLTSLKPIISYFCLPAVSAYKFIFISVCWFLYFLKHTNIWRKFVKYLNIKIENADHLHRKCLFYVNPRVVVIIVPEIT